MVCLVHEAYLGHERHVGAAGVYEPAKRDAGSHSDVRLLHREGGKVGPVELQCHIVSAPDNHHKFNSILYVVKRLSRDALRI